MPTPKLYTTDTLTTALRALIHCIEKEADAPLGFNQDLLVEDICTALGLDVTQILGYTPSEATNLGFSAADAVFLISEPTRPRLEVTP
jgi:hypothetical protein